ncbi:MAG: neutral/alkaline non-lysosomal ceramidase N-terminal domain-containing protein, partial [bacterium]
ASVDTVLAGPLKRLAGPLRLAYKTTQLNFELHTRETFEREALAKNPAEVRRAKAMLKDYDEGHPIRHTPYPVQAIRFDRDLTILALGGEVVVDYDLRVKKEYGSRNRVIVAGYSNDVMCYIPSKRVLKEGGYEAVDSMMYYGQPGPFADDVEDRIFDAIHQVMARVGVKPPERAER